MRRFNVEQKRERQSEEKIDKNGKNEEKKILDQNEKFKRRDKMKERGKIVKQKSEKNSKEN